MTILYHRGKAKVVADSLSLMAENIGSLDFIPATPDMFNSDLLAIERATNALANIFARLDISEPSRVLAFVVMQSSLIIHINARQCDDPHFHVLKDTWLGGGSKEVVIGDDGVL
ncbi:uncharacterized protein [Nicotiana tomentosiformis]|uniref:uncharacterized protein n=1 Tax=Nicotiana tomentosiformis TaxID=4098 RepID=UPI00388C8704